MRKTLLGCLVVLSTVAACSPKIAPTPTLLPPTPVATLTPFPTPSRTLTPTPAYPDLAIELVEGEGLLSSAYRLTIDANGNVSCEVLVDGTFMEKGNAKITPQQIEELVVAIEKADLFALEDSYCGYPATDVPSIDLSITLDGRTKRILQSPGLTCGGGDFVNQAPVALHDLERKILAMVSPYQWIRWTPVPSPTPIISSASVAITVFVDANGDGIPQVSELVDDVAVQVIFPDGKVLSATTNTAGFAQFDLSGYATGTRLTATLPDADRSYRFYLPQTGTVPVYFRLDG